MDIKPLEKIISSQSLLKDRYRLRRLFKNIQSQNFKNEEELLNLELQCDEAKQRFENRLAGIPELTYPEELPVSNRREEIINAIRTHQVIIVAGATGSGKTTQLPKMCLEAGRGRYGFIGHTQPRRIAARTVAQRLCQELSCNLGDAVGYKIRFSDETKPHSLIKIMTDGVLLSELSRDRFLDAYDTIIIDEAHERSLNIDFLLGYLKTLLQRRRDLKLIITSATIDVERFSSHFGGAPVIEVSGRTYPVETFYRPPLEDEDNPEGDVYEEVLLAINDLSRIDQGDILIFLDGERSINELADFLNRQDLRNTEILPLYARLSASDQNKIFQPHAGRHIVLCTNVAETSLTVPGIKYVIDLGLARISRYSPRTKVQRLPIEPISKASADQRRGRCGRTCPGICIRLYSEEDFNLRPDFTDPEILRTNLASVILQMKALRLGNIENFPFIDPPEARQINDGYRLLEEIGALKNGEVTPEGRMIARIPADPRLAKMLITASSQGSLSEITIIAAGLSVQDPRERPLSKKEASAAMHQRFVDERSDFISLLNLWKYVKSISSEKSYAQLRRIARKEFLSYLRIREWEDLKNQLDASCRELGLKFNQVEADYNAVHRPVVSALLSHAGMKGNEKNEYIGARGGKFVIAYTSGLHRKNHAFVIAAELTETTRLYARNVAKIEPEWLEEYGKNYLKYTYSDIHWSKKQGAVLAKVRISLFGLPIITDRLVKYDRIEPALCRELFIRHGLVEGDLDCRYRFFVRNRQLIDQVLDEEDKARRKDILISEEDMQLFYENKIPETAVSWISFKSWWDKKQQTEPHLLDFSMDFLIRDPSRIASKQDFPDRISAGRYPLAVNYHFDPTADDDGVTVKIPLAVLNQISVRDFDFIVPGLRLEFFTEIIRTLPKNLRRLFIPAPDTARKLMSQIDPDTKTLWLDIERTLTRIGGTPVKKDDFCLENLPKHLIYNFLVVDEKNRKVQEGRSLEVLQQDLASRQKENFAQIAEASATDERIHTVWDFGEIKKQQTERIHSLNVVTYPSLKDEVKGVRLIVCETPVQQQSGLKEGVRRLIMLSIASPVAYLHSHLPNKTKLGLYYHNLGNISELINDCVSCAVDHLMEEYGEQVWNKSDFEKLYDFVRSRVNETTAEVASRTEQSLLIYNDLSKGLKGSIDFRCALNLSHVKAQLGNLIFRGFVTATGYSRLEDLKRYMTALKRRLEKIPTDPRQDQLKMQIIDSLAGDIRDLKLGFSASKGIPPEIDNLRWMLEELKVSFFAQNLGTKYPVSEKRVYAEIRRVKDLLK